MIEERYCAKTEDLMQFCKKTRENVKQNYTCSSVFPPFALFVMRFDKFIGDKGHHARLGNFIGLLIVVGAKRLEPL